MKQPFFRRIFPQAPCGAVIILLAVTLLTTHHSAAQAVVVPPAGNTRSPLPEPAIPAILKVFAHFDVVAMPAAHGQKDLDDLILALIRDPRFPESVNDIVVECGNLRYQPVLDQYIAGENVPFAEVQHVWRDTTVQQMCGASAFYEQLYPVVRALNQHLPPDRRLRVVAADPPIDWNQIHTYEDLRPFFDRDGSIASVMQKEVLSRHRKALMLFGIFHILHGGGPGEGDAVTRLEHHYPGAVFVISDLGYYGTGNELLQNMSAPGEVWPSLLRTRNSKLGSLHLSSFLQSPLFTDQNCNVREAFGGRPTKSVMEQIDAFLYLGPQATLLFEPLPADIALDRVYRAEWLRRMRLVGLPGPPTLDEIDAQTITAAADPLLSPPSRQPASQQAKSSIRQNCLAQKQAPANLKK